MYATLFLALINLLMVCVFVGLLVLLMLALLKYIRSKHIRNEKAGIRQSLGEALKGHRTHCKIPHAAHVHRHEASITAAIPSGEN